MSDISNAGASAPVEAQVSEQSEETNVSTGGESVETRGDSSAPDYEGYDDDSSNDSDSEAAIKEEARKEAARRKKLKLKVNGKELEKEIDFDDDDSLREIYQKALASDEKFQKASQLEKQMELIGRMIQENPWELLKEAGYNTDELAEQYMEQRLQELEKSPEQRQIEEFQKELEKERKLREKYEKEKFEAEQARIQEEYARNLNDEITEGLKSIDLPKSPYIVKRIAEVLMVGLDRGKELTVKDVVPYVQNQIKSELRQMFEAMPEEVIEAILGDNVSKKLRNRRLSKMKKPVDTSSQVKSTGDSEINKAKADEGPKEKISARDFFKNL